MQLKMPHRIEPQVAGEISDARPAGRRTGFASGIRQLKAERDQLLDRIARLQAEFENARKRAEREKGGVSRICYR